VVPHGRLGKDRVAALAELLKRAVTRSLSASQEVGLCLTAGVDSRTLLAAAADAQRPFFAYSAGRTDSTDVTVAQELAGSLGLAHVFEPIGPERIAGWLFPMVFYQGGQVATLYSHPCQSIDYPLPFDSMIQGTGGEFARCAPWMDARTLRQRRFDAELLHEKFSTSDSKRLSGMDLWSGPHHDMAVEVKEERLRTMVDKYHPEDHPLAAMKLLAMCDANRQLLNKALVISRASREVLCPYLDHEWVAEVAAVPLEVRARNNLQLDIVRHLQPQLLKAISNHTMLPMGASRPRVNLSRRTNKWRHRAARATGLPLQRAEVPSTDYPRWISDELRPTIDRFLYATSAAFRQYLNWPVVQAALDEHCNKGRRRWTSFISALMVFEIAHKLWIERDRDVVSGVREALPTGGTMRYLGDSGETKEADLQGRESLA